MPVRIAEVCLAETAITPFAMLGGDNHVRLIPRRNALAEYPARLSFFFAWSFSSADVIPEAHLTNSSSRSPHRRLPTAALRPCCYSTDGQTMPPFSCSEIVRILENSFLQARQKKLY